MNLTTRMLVAFVCVLPVCLFGQTAPDDAKADDLVKLETFTVTGSYIPFASTQNALPVKVINAQEIADTGVATNVLDVLRKVAPQFTGNANIGNENANVAMGSTGGGSILSMRNTQTLVLVNGRRMAYAPVLSSGGLQFVDVNMIPISAVERIEVLQDGASATYGTDAIGGVVNIILRTDYEGFEVNARYSVSPNEGHYAERLYSVVGGVRSGKTSVTLSAEYADSDELPQYQREFSSPTYGTPTFGGVINTRIPNQLAQFYVLNPSLAAPPPGHTPLATLVADGVYIPVSQFNLTNGLGSERQYAFDLSLYTKLLTENERRSATFNLEHRVSDRLTFFGDVLYVTTHSHSELNAQPFGPVLQASNPSNPTTQTMVVRNRFTDHPRLYDYDSRSIRGIVGARGTVATSLNWEAALVRNVITQDYTNGNLVESSSRAAAIASGALNLAAREQAPGAIEASGIFGTAWGKADSTITTGDARVTGELLDLPGGPLGFAVGTEYRVEKLTQDSDPNSQTATFNWDAANELNPFDETRRVWSAFAELRLPLVGEGRRLPAVHTLELSAAVRHERYSDTDNPTVPKFSLAWRPVNDEFLLRGSYSESFAAPTLFQLYGPSSVENAVPIQFVQLGGGNVVRDFHAKFGSNPDLDPSRSSNTTFGFVWSPGAVKGLSVSADWFDIVQTDLITSILAPTIVQDVELNGPDSPYAKFVWVGGFGGTPISAPGQLSAALDGDIYVTGTLVNIANQKLRGADVRLEYYRGTVARGRVEASLAMTFYDSYSFQSLPSVDSEETVGLATDFNGTIPRWQSYASVAWTRGPWHANAGWRHVPGVGDPQVDGTERKPLEIASYDSFDVSASWTLDLNRKWARQMVVRIGANNVFNRMPPFGGGTFTLANADTGTYGAIGRLLFIEGRYKF